MIIMPGDRQRMTARRMVSEDIINGKYYKQEGFDPNYLVTPSGVRVSRVELVGTVVDTFVNDEETYGAITIDDGSEVIRAKFFQELEGMEGLEEGDIVQIVGKVRKYDDEIYVQPEFLKERDIEYELLHNLEVKETNERWQKGVEKVRELQDKDKSDEDIIEEMKGEGFDEEDTRAILTYVDPDEQFDTASEVDSGTSFSRSDMEESEREKEGDKKIVLGIIEDLDDGEGAGYSEIIDKSDMSEETVESVINDLLSDGTCYEPKPGKIKKL